jgi:hypothetical protein
MTDAVKMRIVIPFQFEKGKKTPIHPFQFEKGKKTPIHEIWLASDFLVAIQ